MKNLLLLLILIIISLVAFPNTKRKPVLKVVECTLMYNAYGRISIKCPKVVGRSIASIMGWE